jgi:hypothetical protein
MLNNLLLAAETRVNVNISGNEAVGNISTFSVGGIISWAITIILVFAGLIFFFMLLIGGIQWITSGGDKVKTENARNRITAALIGLVIVFSAWAIAQLLNTIFGVNIFDFEIPTITGDGAY